jgi:8-oxo-dGTP pyrophosphatase MutT (NUDIX family)
MKTTRRRSRVQTPPGAPELCSFSAFEFFRRRSSIRSLRTPKTRLLISDCQSGLNDLTEDRVPRPRLVASRKLADSWRVSFYEDLLQYGTRKPVPYARFTVPDFAIALAVRERDRKVALVRQYRHGARRNFWELPAGLVEVRERPVDCVRREFREEVGYELDEPMLVTQIFSSPARSSQVAYVFSGTVGKRSRKHLDPSEIIRVKFVSNASALKLLSRTISATHLLAYLLASRQQN